MYVYVIVRTYHTGVSNIYEVFSSEQKAGLRIEEILFSAYTEGWDVDREWLAPTTFPIHRSRTGIIRYGAPHNTEMFHYEKREVI